MYKLKEIAKRGSALAGVVGLLAGIGSSALPALASADALNPLTERSLTLSSSSPGWAFTDGSGNSTYAPPNSGANGQKSGNYFSFRVSTDSAYDSGSDGPDNPIKAMSFQYCTKSAGECLAPGDDTPITGPDDASHADLNVHYPSAAEISGAATAGAGTVTLTSGSAAVVGAGTSFTSLRVGGTFTTVGNHTYVIKSIADATHLNITTNAAATEAGVTYTMSAFEQVIDPATGNVKAVPGYTNNNPKYIGSGDAAEAAKDVAGNFIVMYDNAGTWTQSTGWTVSTSNQEEDTINTHTGMQNAIILQNSTGLGLPSGAAMKVLFFATSTNYITNPGSGYFFVKINTFKNFDPLAGPTPGPENTLADNIAKTPSDVIDGGVTVANVMNQSIQITTKVLETMEFSVGTVDPDTLTDAQLTASDNGSASHQACDTILTRMIPSDPQNVLQLGSQAAESSLETAHTYATHSYWRLSSNSSAGATVYYSGHTLSNTSGDEIAPIGTIAKASAVGSEQFGLALDTVALSGTTGVPKLDSGTYGVDYSTAGATYENGADNTAAGVVAAGTTIGAGGVDDSVLTNQGADLVTPDYSALNKSYHTPKLDPLAPMDGTNGTTDYGSGSGTITSAGTAKFAFDPMSDTVPAPIASENSQVVDCVTGKMRYIANIAATTPAGIYTTKINYIAAPQY